jgi:hypothetical protein
MRLTLWNAYYINIEIRVDWIPRQGRPSQHVRYVEVRNTLSDFALLKGDCFSWHDCFEDWFATLEALRFTPSFIFNS